MSAFRSVIAAKSNAPARVVTLPASAWAPSWAARPDGGVRIGLRLYAEADATAARAAASGSAWRLHPGESEENERVEAYNGALMALMVARSTCHAEDASLPFWEVADDAVPTALTPGGIEFLFGEIDRMLVEDSPTAPEAGDEEMAWLSAALASGEVWRSLDVAQVTRARRLLAAAIEQMSI